MGVDTRLIELPKEEIELPQSIARNARQLVMRTLNSS
tara:strand:- start:335 stop:445 length:111 start_codon:yes stop_codon:yes gene_type:complete